MPAYRSTTVSPAAAIVPILALSLTFPRLSGGQELERSCKQEAVSPEHDPADVERVGDAVLRDLYPAVAARRELEGHVALPHPSFVNFRLPQPQPFSFTCSRSTLTATRLAESARATADHKASGAMRSQGEL
mmetsp:Transcript_29846/g.95477  ORF Transcript_29846/g.95477 Transcript_29846/m.95477 type:complete len:132 (-) Transcript_29846:374-769(-)